MNAFLALWESTERNYEMHNCKDSKEALMEAALHGRIPIPDEFVDCPRCREEFDSLRGTMQMTDVALQLVQPRENFWVGYEARLRRRLANDEQPASRSPLRTVASLLRGLVTASVPVPAPLALAGFGLVVFSTLFLLHSRTISNAKPIASQPTIVRTIEVPLIKEKQVTRVVYRDRRVAKQTAGATLGRDSAMVATRRGETPATQSLAGFSPVPEARLTLIKGSRDEK
jgi:hypothetical protein